ncbi:MAG: tetratricopeptide repeat protein [Leptospiraceae bacterium]|nr:tetratricopeptide repeat protein [Leptospiraceae bacterium]
MRLHIIYLLVLICLYPLEVFSEDTLLDLMKLGETSLSQGNYDSAITSYEKALQKCDEKNTDAKLSILEKLGSLNFRKQIYKEAIRYQKEALELGCKIRGEASLYCGDANKNLGNYYFKIEETDTALEAYESSRSIYQKALPAKDAKLGLISSLIGDCYFAKGNFQKALEYYLQDLEISEFVLGKTSPELGIIFNSIGIAYRNLGKYDLALTYYKKDFEINQSHYGITHRATANSMNNIAAVYMHKGDYEKALQEYFRSLSEYLKGKPVDLDFVAKLYNNIGATYERQGELDKSIEYYEKAIKQYRLKDNNKYSLAIGLNNLGIAYFKKTDLNLSIDYYKAAIKIAEELSLFTHPFYATVNANLAVSYFHAGDFKESLRIQEKVLEIRLKQYKGDNPDLATSYESIGNLSLKMGDKEKGKEYLEKTVKMLEASIPNQPRLAFGYNSLGHYYLERLDFENALLYYNKAFAILKTFKDRMATIDTMLFIKNTYLKQGETAKAIEVWNNAVESIVKFRQEMGRDKYFFTERYRTEFEKLILKFISMQLYKEAFYTSEKMRALSITESFNLKTALTNGKINKEEVEKVINLLSDIESLYSARASQLSRGKQGEAESNKIFQELMQKEQEFEQLDKRLKQKYPEYAKFREPPSLNLNLLLEKLKNSKKNIIEYLILTNEKGAKEIHVFVLGDNFNYLYLGEQNDLVLKIENLRRMISTYPKDKAREFYELTTPESGSAYYSVREMAPDLVEGDVIKEEVAINSQSLALNADSPTPKVKTIVIGKVKSRINRQAIDEKIKKFSQEIYNQILNPIIEKKILNSSQIVIVPDGSIYTIPFPALLDHNRNYLVENYTFSLIQSANVWYFLSNFKREANYKYPVLGIGNPVYNKASDKKKKKGSDKRQALRSGLTRGLSFDTIETGLSNLPGSLEEIKEIKELFYKKSKGSDKHLFTGLHANKDSIFKLKESGELNLYRVVHFSVHGLFFSDSPELNSLALTSRAIAAKYYNAELKEYESKFGTIKSDSFLKNGEILDLGINAELIVMSACETSLGTQLSGEGFVGLPQAFLIGGSKYVIATLWSIDDKGSNLFMNLLYKNLLSAKKYDRLPMILQETQREFIKNSKANGQQKYSDPFYWSPFVIYGE